MVHLGTAGEALPTAENTVAAARVATTDRCHDHTAVFPELAALASLAGRSKVVLDGVRAAYIRPP